MSRYERFAERYAAGEVPWDHADPPPEVLAYVPTLPPGRALDLGCGYGRATLFIAGLGWQVDGVDFVPAAVREARARAEAAGLADRARFHEGNIAHLDFLAGPYDLALDVGSMHSLSQAELRGYHAGLLRLLAPGGVYLLFAHLQDKDQDPLSVGIAAFPSEAAGTTGTGNADLPRWLDEALMRKVFAVGFTLERVEYGTTQVAGKPPWPSGWFWWRRAKANLE